jgi:hypothetical protein
VQHMHHCATLGLQPRRGDLMVNFSLLNHNTGKLLNIYIETVLRCYKAVC